MNMYSLLQHTPGPASCLSALVSLKKTSFPVCWASTKSGNGLGTLWGEHMSTWIAALANVLHLYSQPFQMKEGPLVNCLAPLSQGTKVQFRDSCSISASWSGPGSQKTGTEMELDAHMLRSHQVSWWSCWNTNSLGTATEGQREIT